MPDVRTGDYGPFAEYFDAYWEHPGFRPWVLRVIELASAVGISGGRALDVGCGTGRVTEALLGVGFDTTGLDVSPEMLAVARRKLPATPLICTAVQELDPHLMVPFDLVLWLNDGCNHILEPDELSAAFTHLSDCMRPGAVMAFDANQRPAFAEFFSGSHERRRGPLRFDWEGRCDIGVHGRRLARATLTASDADGALEASWEHVQRFHPDRRIRAALRASGLEIAAAYGFDNQGAIADRLLASDLKALYLARKPSAPDTERSARAQGQAQQASGDADAFSHQDGLTAETRSRERPGPLRCAPERSPVRLPRLKQTVDVRELPDGRLLVLRGDLLGHDLELEGDTTRISALLGLLDGRRDLPEIGQGLDRLNLPSDEATVAEALHELDEAGLIEDAADDVLLDAEYRERFSRQLAFFSDLAVPGQSAVAAQQRLQAASVCVLGIGGLGSWAALGLACAGIGRLTIVDGDRLELSNLNRQILFRQSDVGQPKASAAARHLRRFSTATRVRSVSRRLSSADDIEEVIAGSDLVIAAADSPPHQIDRWTDQACFASGIPYLTISQQPPKIRMGPLYVPGQTGCFDCLESRYRRDHPDYDSVVASSPLTSPAATFGPACGMVGSMAANEAVAFLAGLWTPATAGRSWIIDLRSFAITAGESVAEDGCPRCEVPS